MGGDIYAPLDRLLHALLPAPCLGCGRPLPARRSLLGLCAACRGRLRPPPSGFAGGRSRPPAFERLLAGWRYEPPLDAVIARLKFGRLDYLGSHLGCALARQLGDRLVGRPAALPADPADPAGVELVVAVPLHWRRRLARGYDQAAAIARPLARELGLPFAAALVRRRPTPPQTALGRAGRLANLRGAFAVRRLSRERIRGRRVLLVDDVATTGATLDAAAAALRSAGAAAVVALVAARTPENI